MTSNPGVLPLLNCDELSLQSEGLYTCVIRDADLIVHELKVGLYFDRGGNHGSFLYINQYNNHMSVYRGSYVDLGRGNEALGPILWN